MFRWPKGRSGPLSLQLPHWASLLFEILDCGCLRTSFKLYLAFLAIGRLTYKLLASVTGSGDTLGVFCHLKPHVTHSNCIDQVYLIPGKTRTRGPCLVPMVVFLIRIPSLPGLFQWLFQQAAHAAWRQRSRSPLCPCPCQPRAGLAMTGCWWWRRRLRKEGLRGLYSVTWSHVGFLFQLEKMTAFSLPSSFTLSWKMNILFIKLSTVVFLKATVEVLKTHLRELQ